MEIFRIKGSYIQLNQLLKVTGWCDNGAEANVAIESGEVYVNGSRELRKRNKIIAGAVVEFNGKSVMIE